MKLNLVVPLTFFLSLISPCVSMPWFFKNLFPGIHLDLDTRDQPIVDLSRNKTIHIYVKYICRECEKHQKIKPTLNQIMERTEILDEDEMDDELPDRFTTTTTRTRHRSLPFQTTSAALNQRRHVNLNNPTI